MVSLEFCHLHYPSGRTTALGSTQPLTEMSTNNIFWGIKAAVAYGCKPYHLQVPIVLKSGSLNLLEPSGPVQASNEIAILSSANNAAISVVFTVAVLVLLTVLNQETNR
jgi:hypothetical protein